MAPLHLSLSIACLLLASTHCHTPAGPHLLPTKPAHPLAVAAEALIDPGVRYDPGYRSIPYPGGDVPARTGVCADVVVRAFRRTGLDLQKAVHEDMKKHFTAYPQAWGLRRPDANIDHRRVPNLQCFFKRKGMALPVVQVADHFLPGDVVTWMVKGRLPHIGIVSNRPCRGGRWLVVHNIGGGQVAEDCLMAWPVTGHYRVQ